jgi:O-antigen ligase
VSLGGTIADRPVAADGLPAAAPAAASSTADAPAAAPSTTAAPAAASSTAAGHRGAAFALLMVGYPVAWAIGLAPIWYLMVAAPMAVWVLWQRPLVLPSGTVLFGLFLVVVAASAIQLNSVGRIAIYGLRTSWYIAAFVVFVYLAAHRGLVDQALVARAMVAMWALVILGGWLSVLAPELAWTTPVSAVLPAALTSNEFINQLVSPQVSEIQVFRYQDVTLYRPAAPFAYTNAWGSTVAMSTPFVIAALHDRDRIGIPRKLIVALLALGLVPFYVALNRGSWLTLGVGLLYGVARWAVVRKNLLPLLALFAALSLGCLVAVSSGVLTTATEQLETRSADSNERRSGIYTETIRSTAKSPLIGYGSTRPNPADPEGPPLGTHGQLWSVLFAHGYLGLGLYLAFFISAFVRSRPVDPLPHWAKVSLLIGLLQLPIYGHLPHQIFVMVAAVSIASWGGQRSPWTPWAGAGSGRRP